jgi:hypothetical protein
VPLVLFSSTVVIQAQLLASACSDDGQIAADKRAAFDSATVQFFSALISADFVSAYEQLAADARENLTVQQIATLSKSMLRPMKVEHLRVDHTYDATFTGSTVGRVVCGTLSDNKWVSVAARSGEQAHVLLSADFINGHFAFEAWLVTDDGKWKIEGFWFGASSLADYDAEKIWALARGEASKKHRFNAAVLYATALQLTNRGQYLQLGLSNAISQDSASFSPSPEIAGQPPFEWKDGSSVYKVLTVGPIAIAGKLHIVINHETGPWANDKEVDDRNKNLLAYFKRTFPEYRDAFPSIIIQAHERGTTRGFGTVEQDTETVTK